MAGDSTPNSTGGGLAGAAIALAVVATGYIAKRLFDRARRSRRGSTGIVNQQEAPAKTLEADKTEPVTTSSSSTNTASRELHELSRQGKAPAIGPRQTAETPSKPLTGVEAIAKTRLIEHLVHFTPINKLRYIVNEGILTHQEVQRMNREILDELRLDGKRDHICTSISFPNYQMFHSYSALNKADWCVLLLDPSLLWRRECLFYPYNAASSELARASRAEFKGPIALECMFAETIRDKRRSTLIRSNMTTSPQAEVLIPGCIPTECILKVHFFDAATRLEHLPHLSQAEIASEVSTEYFAPRADWKLWSPTYA